MVGIAFFNNENDQDDFNVVIKRKNIQFSFLSNNYAYFQKDKDENWTLIFIPENLINKSKEDELTSEFFRLQSNMMIMKKESCSAIIGDEDSIINHVHFIKQIYLRKSVYKSHSLLSLLGFTSPYLYFPSSLNINFESFDGLNSFQIELGGGETHCGSNWIDCKLENIPTLKGEMFSQENISFLENSCKTIRLSWSQITEEFNNFQ